MKERRHDTRKKASALVYYNVASKDGAVAGEGMAKVLDLSKDGAHLEMGRQAAAGEEINLTVSVGDDMVDLKGKTVWSREGADHYEAGVKMEDPPGSYTEMLDKLP